MRILLLFFLLPVLVLPASGLEILPPEVPPSGRELMPEDTSDFSRGFSEILRKALSAAAPALTDAMHCSRTLLCAALILSVLKVFSHIPGPTVQIASAVIIAGQLLQRTDSFIRLAADTVTALSDYGKLLLPVMTTALAAQGGIGTSAALYAGTAAFDLILCGILPRFLVPMVYGFLLFATAFAALEQTVLKKMRDFLKWLITWSLKTLLTVYTAYLSITGIVSGTADAMALKAAKTTISAAVPVVGGILSNASEALLVSAGLIKNAAGIYGILAALAVFLGPFLRIGAHGLVLRLTAALCSLLGSKAAETLTEDFSTAMGLLLAMTAASCLMVLISTVCFLKGCS